MDIIISLALATICFTYHGTEECHPVLLGGKIPTPIGDFNLTRRYTSDPGYNGDVLQFSETPQTVYAIHRVWLLRPDQKRLERLKSPNIKDHFITSGCVNVEPEVYEKLVDCCLADTLHIK